MDGSAACSTAEASSSRQQQPRGLGLPRHALNRSQGQSSPLPMTQYPWMSSATSWLHLNQEDLEHVSRSAPPSALTDLVTFGQTHASSTAAAPSLLLQTTDRRRLSRRSSPTSSTSSAIDLHVAETLDLRQLSDSPSSDQYDFCGADSPPSHILHFDRPPNARQRSIAEDSILARQIHLSTLDMQVAAAHAAVIAASERHRLLLAQRAVLRAQICRDRNRLQPALYLPAETLAEIFAYCAQDDIYAVWKLSAVCFDWHVAAVAYPRLWCRIVVPTHLPPVEQIHITRLWVQRTSTVQGLDIRYRAVEDSIRYVSTTFEEIMMILSAELSRWKHFDLETNLEDCIHIAVRLSSGAAPNLETFLVREPEFQGTKRNRRLLPCKMLTLGPAPNLSRVALHTSAWPTATFLRGLTTLSLSSGRIKPMVDLWRVLDACEDLEELTLRLPVDHDFDPPGRGRTSPLKLERLHTLSGNSMVLALLPHLLVPSLEVLYVNDVDAFILMRTLNVLDLRSNPPLHTLRLRSCRLVSGTTGLSLKSIKRLEFYESEVDDNFSLPLHAYRGYIVYVREDALRRLVEARNPTTPNAMCAGGAPAVGLPARIKMVEVRNCRRVRPQFTEWIQERLGRVSDRFHLPSCSAASAHEEQTCAHAHGPQSGSSSLTPLSPVEGHGEPSGSGAGVLDVEMGMVI
ncbi:SubName: Full=Uncharacterized protein {ECO:0000313/EMBL:CCA67872.1} [Serendipita indica DSM 11827]|nr:SubName: Full=Uncharacterized protein {ECO:0000313/EMBL:CCA67872.1} [Serendipita indica DSM 11827]